MRPCQIAPRLFGAALLTWAAAVSAQPVGVLELKPYTFETSGGETAPAEWGRIRVPEDRSRPGGPSIELALVRFRSRSQHPGPPIFFLPGGPGNSTIDAGRMPERFPLFMKALDFGDVILVDQRGVGASRPRLDCDEKVPYPADRPVTRASHLKIYRAAARRCAESWRRRGVELGAYNTNASADDLDDVRRALGAEKMVLWGLSYGNHWALATIRRHPDRIERAIMAGVEGQDHTAKLPATYRAHLRQLADLVRRDPVLGAQIPDLERLLETVVKRLDARPKRLLVKDSDSGETRTVMLNGTLLNWTLGGIWGSDGVPILPLIILQASRGYFDDVAYLLGRYGSGLESAMHAAMDCASGVSPARQRRVKRQYGDFLFRDVNFPYMEGCSGWGVKPIGPGFWAPVHSSIPVLFISGTLDAKTPPFQAEEIRRGFPNSAHLIVDGAVHSNPLFLSNPRIKDVIFDFLAGKPVRDGRLDAEPIKFLSASPFTPPAKR
ncbi:MAG TPA: alpha/beta hydrolase [Allosphingosinicella sp.]|jgi:pimeloyl-ACP methyl ester carboxylesterase